MPERTELSKLILFAVRWDRRLYRKKQALKGYHCCLIPMVAIQVIVKLSVPEDKEHRYI